MKIPYIKIYTADLLAKSRHLTDAQIGRALVGICEQAFENQTQYKANDEAEGALFELFLQWKNESVSSLKSRKRAGKIGAQARWSNTQLSDGSKRISSAISKCECQTETDAETEAETDTGTDKEKIVKKETSVKRFVKPTLAEVMEYCESRKNGIDAEAFIAYYESVGWKVNTKPMRDWKAAVITWEKRRQMGGRSYGKDYNKRDADFSKYEGIGRTISSENA
ncbi:MAG: hypothetical protein J6Y17_01880 [Elusimicrobiaceae bacterium]|nr:hypothetical protein [Elusimicrobiaceae bacterium]